LVWGASSDHRPYRRHCPSRHPAGELIHDDYILEDALVSQLDSLKWELGTDLYAVEGEDPLKNIEGYTPGPF
jgi:hypothetical protein